MSVLFDMLKGVRAADPARTAQPVPGLTWIAPSPERAGLAVAWRDFEFSAAVFREEHGMEEIVAQEQAWEMFSMSDRAALEQIHPAGRC